jgi:hypothetical protein
MEKDMNKNIIEDMYFFLMGLSIPILITVAIIGQVLD